jgi:hypothetical protein
MHGVEPRGKRNEAEAKRICRLSCNHEVPVIDSTYYGIGEHSNFSVVRPPVTLLARSRAS